MPNRPKQPAIPIEGLKDLVCDHNGFAHRVFPYVVRREGAAIFDRLAPGSPLLPIILADTCAVVEEHFTRQEDSALLWLKDITVTQEDIARERMLILALTPPAHTIGTFFIGLIPEHSANPDANYARYLTFERADDSSTDPQALVCEWIIDDEGNCSHRNHGFLSPATIEAFKEAVTFMLSLTRTEPQLS